MSNCSKYFAERFLCYTRSFENKANNREVSNMKLKTIVLPHKYQLDQVTSQRCYELLNENFNVKWNDTGKDYTEKQLSELIDEAEIILTSWGSPIITSEMLKRADKLRFIGHAAGTVKNRIPKEAFGKNIRIFSAAPRIAQSVGEYCMAVLFSTLRYINDFNQDMHSGKWNAVNAKGHELTGNTIGIVAASSTAKAFISYLKPFNVELYIYDPYITEEEAENLGGTKATLSKVMQCPIISVHAPSIPETNNLISRELIKSIPDGAVLINSSRASVLDNDTLIEELRKGRFTAALDVFSKEPLEENSELRNMKNVLLTPHIAGTTVEGHKSLMEAVVNDIIRTMKGEPTQFEVYESSWNIIA
jgi:phosphoglycerate dehydrogenase-like enzyme